jgi:peptide deformylase
MRDEQIGWEACLSVPNYVARVPRANDVTVRAQDPDGRWRTHRGKGFFARALLHETDHLLGRLYVDLVDPSELVDTRKHPTPPD